MGKFNTKTAPPAASGPIVTERVASGITHEGGAGYARDAKSELFLLAVSNMVGEDTFYEKAGARDERFERLVRTVAVADPAWMLGFVGWLRLGANMRSASLVAAVEAVKARLDAGVIEPAAGVRTQRPGAVGAELPREVVSNRAIIAAALQRADEPGELLAYWTARYGRALPKPVKRGVADAVGRLYTEYALAKWDSDSAGFRFGDVLDLAHPTAATPAQGDLFRHAIDRRHGRAQPWAELPTSLPLLRARGELMDLPVADRRAVLARPDAVDVLRAAGITWEALAGWLQGPMDAAAWEKLIPTMGYLALLRNLRNFDQTGVSDTVASAVQARLADPEQVVKSRVLPMRFLSAHRAAPSLRWGYPLEQALGHSLANVPALPGRTLILVDTSSSMNAGFSKDGTLMRWDAAVIFGVALGQRCATADVVSFSSSARYWGEENSANTKVFPLQRGESLLKAIDRWQSGGWFLGGGTATAAALRKHWAGHDRVVIVTDEQANADGREVSAAAPATTPIYTWNLAGYERGHTPSGVGTRRHTFGGLTDAAFGLIPLLERQVDGAWPWETTAA